MFRRLLIAFLLLIVIVVVAADRVGAKVGAHVLASKLETDEHLSSRPSTSIGGIPFLTQAFGGKYTNVSVTAHNVLLVDNVTVTTLSAHLHGVHLPFGKVIGGSVSQVPVDRVDGTAFVSFADANAYLRTHAPAGGVIKLSPGTSNTVKILERLRGTGKKLGLRGVGAVTLADNTVTVSISGLTPAKAAGGAGQQVVAHLAKNLLSASFPLQELPFRIALNSVKVGSTGVTATGDATDIVLGSHPNS